MSNHSKTPTYCGGRKVRRVLDREDIATILEALRCYQKHLSDGGGRIYLDDDLDVLDFDEIDDLCESINLAEKVEITS